MASIESKVKSKLYFLYRFGRWTRSFMITYNPYVRSTHMWWVWYLRWLNTVNPPSDDFEFTYLPHWADPREWRD